VKHKPAVVWTGSVAVFFLVWAVVAFATSNVVLSVASVALMALLVHLMWRPGEPPVLLFVLFYHWLQVCLKIWHANVLRLPVGDLRPRAPDVTVAIWLGMAALVVLAMGMRLGTLGLKVARKEVVREQARWLSPGRIFMFYMGFALLNILQNPVIGRFPTFRQPILAAADLRWVFLFVLGYVALSRKQGRPMFWFAIGLEFIGGIGYFSDFKTVGYMGLLLVGALIGRIRLKAVAIGLTLGVPLVFLATAWSAAKKPYREILGNTPAALTVGARLEHIAVLSRVLGGLGAPDLAIGRDLLLERVAYVDYFAYALGYVPERLPHTDGELWIGAVRNATMPRAFFPTKPSLPLDSDVTMRYTGLRFPTSSETTSISMGYVADSYIDFGYYGMWFPILLIGCLWGLMYQALMRLTRAPIFAYAFCASLFLSAAAFESPAAKVLGGVLMKFLVFLFMIIFVLPYILPLVRERRARSRMRSGSVYGEALAPGSLAGG
jgi:hypothetical protein